MENIKRHYWPSWAKKSRKNAPIRQKRKCSFIKTMHACILKLTCEKYYIFQKLFKVFHSDDMFFNVAL